jgi:hypothetical protein
MNIEVGEVGDLVYDPMTDDAVGYCLADDKEKYYANR